MRRQLNVTLAELIYEAQPYQRQIVMMREPVSRYYSAFHYYRCAEEGAIQFFFFQINSVEGVWGRKKLSSFCSDPIPTIGSVPTGGRHHHPVAPHVSPHTGMC